jgi:agmatine deiminase
MNESPRTAGYRWPAEWERHAATWLAWPHNRQTWPGKFEVIPQRFAQFVRAVAKFEPVRLLASEGKVAGCASRWLGDMNDVEIFDIQTDDAWIRDYGPSFLRRDQDSAIAVVDWSYNAWGGKYPPFDRDNAAPQRIAAALAEHRIDRQMLSQCFAGPLTLEGGAVDANGIGDILSTQSCLLSESRNPGRSSAQLEDVLQEFLSAEKVHWLPNSTMAGDDTDGHVDQLARFVSESAVVVAVANSDDEQHRALEDNCHFLRESQNRSGKPLEVIPLPLPRPLFHDGQRLPASYCNFYVLNDAVIVPAFGDGPADQRAASVLKDHFPSREVISLDAIDLASGLGAFHCLSQPQW